MVLVIKDLEKIILKNSNGNIEDKYINKQLENIK